LAALVVQWLSTRGWSEQQARELVDTDYAGQAHKAHIQKSAATGKKTEAATPQRQARHLAA
jgi:hypothetical protein